MQLVAQIILNGMLLGGLALMGVVARRKAKKLG